MCGPGDVVCRVLACATCGSDVGWYVRAQAPGRARATSRSARSSRSAPSVDGVAVGDRVAIHHHAPCGECRRCRARPRDAVRAVPRDRRWTRAASPSTCASSPSWSASCCRSTGSTPCAATLTEPLGCALRAQDRAGIRPGDSLLVVGAGCSGLLHVAAAHARGVDAVWVREPDRERLARAEAWGATAHGNEPVDVAMVCTESPAAIAGAAEALAPGGTLCLYAPPAPGSAARRRRLDACSRASCASPRAGRPARPTCARRSRCCAAAPCAPAELITAPFPLEETGAALAAQRSGERAARRVVAAVRAAMLFGDEDLRVIDVADPVPGAGEVLVRIEAATTCGTDVKTWRRGHPLLGALPGAVRPRDGGVREDTGERVLVGDSVACGACRPLRGRAAADLPRPALGVRRLRRAHRRRPRPRCTRSRTGSTPAAAAMAEPLAAAVARDRPRARPARSRPTPACSAAARWARCSRALLVAEGRTVTLADRHAERRAQAEAAGRDERRACSPTTTSSSRRSAGPTPGAAAVQACAPGGCVVLRRRLQGRAPTPRSPPARCTTTSSTCAAPSTTRRAEVDRALALLAEGARRLARLRGRPDRARRACRRPRPRRGGPARKPVVDPAFSG